LLAEAKIIYRLKAGKPIFVGFNVTNRCTMRCRFCNVPELPHRDMTMGEVEHALDLLRQIGVPVVGVTGGEPFLRKDVADIVSAIDKRGMKCTLVTNGDLLDERRMAELRPFGNIVHFALSLDTLDMETYGFLRGKRSLPQTLERYLRSIPYGPDTTYKLNVVVGPENVDELETIIEFAMAVGLALSFIPVNIGPGGLHRAQSYPGLDSAGKETIARAFLKLHDWKLQGMPLWDHRDFYLLAAKYMRGEEMGDCMAGRLFLDLRSDGKLAFCNEMDHFVSLLDLDSLSLDFIREKRSEWAERIDTCRASGACCYTCSYNVTATARNVPAYLWDYARLKFLAPRRCLAPRS